MKTLPCSAVHTRLGLESFLRVDFHCHVISPCVRTYITRVNEIEATYERPRVNVEVERGLTLTYMRDLPYNSELTQQDGRGKKTANLV